jgi:hypothetical protein
MGYGSGPPDWVGIVFIFAFFGAFLLVIILANRRDKPESMFLRVFRQKGGLFVDDPTRREREQRERENEERRKANIAAGRRPDAGAFEVALEGIGEVVAAVAKEHVRAVEDEKYGPLVKAALAWSQYDDAFWDAYILAHRDEILAEGDDVEKAFLDREHPCGTLDGCCRVARWALKHMPLEVEHYLPAAEQRSVDAVAQLLWRYRVHKHDVLLRQARMLHTRELAAAADPSRSPAPDLLSTFPPDERDGLRARLKLAESAADFDQIIEDRVRDRAARLAQSGRPTDDQTRELEVYRSNLERLRRDWMRAHGLRA